MIYIPRLAMCKCLAFSCIILIPVHFRRRLIYEYIFFSTYSRNTITNNLTAFDVIFLCSFLVLFNLLTLISQINNAASSCLGSGCSLRGPLTCVTSIHRSASLLIGAVQEADLVNPGFEQSIAISNRSTLDFTLHCGEQRIVLPGDASWKRLCYSSVPPDDDELAKCSVMASRANL